MEKQPKKILFIITKSTSGGAQRSLETHGFPTLLQSVVIAFLHGKTTVFPTPFVRAY